MSRSMINSEIWNKPSLYLKVWIYLLCNARFKDGNGLKRGQLRTSIPKIQEACTHSIGYRTEQPTKRQIRDVIDWLRDPYEGHDERHNEGHDEGTMKGTMNGAMIVTTKVTHGMLVTICNFNDYQDPKFYERHNERHNERHDERHNENRTNVTTKRQRKSQLNMNKENKGMKKEEIYTGVPPGLARAFSEFAEMREQIKKPITSKRTVDDLLKKLDGIAKTIDEKVEIINKSTDKCWTEFYPLDKKDKPEKPPSYKEFAKEEFESENFKAEPMPEELRQKLGKIFD